MSNVPKRVLFLGIVTVVAVSLGACRPEEQGRVLSLEPGVYLGKNPDKNLTKEMMAKLRARTLYQSGATKPVGGSNNHGISSIDLNQINKLRLRTWSQSGRKE